MPVNDSLWGTADGRRTRSGRTAAPLPRATSWRSAFFGRASPADPHAVAAAERSTSAIAPSSATATATPRPRDWLHESLEKYQRSRKPGRAHDRQRPDPRAADADLPRPPRAGRLGRPRARDSRCAGEVALPDRACARPPPRRRAGPGRRSTASRRCAPTAASWPRSSTANRSPATIPGREAEECFPPALRHAYDKRGRPTKKRAEPIAADLREERRRAPAGPAQDRRRDARRRARRPRPARGGAAAASACA